MFDLETLRHSTSHVLAAAVGNLYPNTKFGIGPAIENGFYYDFEFSQPISDADLPKIEKEMQKILAQNLPFVRKEVSVGEAKEIFADQPYKLELLEDKALSGNGSHLPSTYKVGGFTDLCKGPHLKNTSAIKAFNLTSVAGAYWKGSEKNPMLTRIYGTAFETKKELDEYLKLQEEAKKRDHKKLGKELDLFLFHETAPGSPYWLPNGLIVLNELLEFWRTEHRQRGYLETATPLVNKKELFQTSGHWEHYKEDMFIADMGENEMYGIKPMNCPGAMIIFASKTRSYKELPLRFSDSDVLHRYERSGVLNGLFRVRSFRQDDAHTFISEDQIKQEYSEILDIAELFYKIFGLEYSLRLGTRPEKFLGEIKTWDQAEKELKEILNKKVGTEKYTILEGDGAFYGPKIDILMKDSLGREWQMGTIQLDFQLPQRFNLSYIGKDGEKKQPVVIHRVIYGSLERFIGILIEHFTGAFPVWLAPVQAVVIPIAERHTQYARGVISSIQYSIFNIRAEIDDRDETMQSKIRNAQLQKIPYMLIVGDNEMQNAKGKMQKFVSVRLRTGEDLNSMPLEKFIERVSEIINFKSLKLWEWHACVLHNN